ncbi:hypothetical protein LINPERHAP1_LOCUS36548 [Linum perenne]
MPNQPLARLIGLTNFSVVANWPGSYERCISVRFKSRFRLSSHPTRFIVL